MAREERVTETSSRRSRRTEPLVLAVLVSGSDCRFDELVQDIDKAKLNGRNVKVTSVRPNARALAIAASAGTDDDGRLTIPVGTAAEVHPRIENTSYGGDINSFAVMSPRRGC